MIGVKGATPGTVPEKHVNRYSGYAQVTSAASSVYLAPDYVDGYRFFYQDHLGSTRQLSEATMQRNYYPYGETLATAGNDETAYQFSGKEKDLATGFSYFGARYYFPGIGRWLVPDPAGQGWSPYAYCGNSPIVMVDPDGRWFGVDDGIAAGIGFVVGYVSYGITTNDWTSSKAFKKGMVGAAAGWVGWNTGGASLAAGSNLSFGATVGYGITSGAASGAVYGGLDYTLQTTKTSDWDFGEFYSRTISSSIQGGITGGITAATMYGLEYYADESGILDKKHSVSSRTKEYKIGELTVDKEISFTAKQNSTTLEELGFPIKTEFKNLGPNTSSFPLFTSARYYYTYRDILYNSTGILNRMVLHSRHSMIQFSLNTSHNSDLRKYLQKEIERSIKKELLNQKINYKYIL